MAISASSRSRSPNQPAALLSHNGRQLRTGALDGCGPANTAVTGPASTAQVTVLGDVAIRSLRRDDVQTICLFGHLHAANADGVQLELERLAATDASSIIIDLSDLESIDPAGARLLLRAHAQSRAHEKRLTLVGPAAAVRRTLEQSDVAQLLPSSDSRHAP